MLSTPGADAAARPGASVQGPGYRLTVLTSRLIRLEYNPGDVFVDLPTQIVVSRDFEVPDYTVTEHADSLEIWTDHLHLVYDKRAFSPAGLSIALRQSAHSDLHTMWHFGDPSDDTLGGTARTLDEVDGACELDPGILARHGFAVLDDSTSITLTPDGWFAARPDGGHDLYFFGYALDFQGALRDYFHLTGPTPLVPRFVLGNWWSRYHRYDAHEYLALMDRFDAAGIPLSVAVIDMDWHLVDIDPSLGTGWTGYTWNRDLFADPEAFLRDLHRRGLAVTLNVHPADGVRRHEQAYAAVASDLGVDPASGHGISFDVTSREFVESYLTRLHHPLEAQGVDFWWIDWQSGSATRVAGLDPLWMLNHIHYRDSARDGGRALTFSRYAGPGSHRYPIGFSGDTVVSWASLQFQPHFTATAANIGYYWWSHDIGGHMWGAKDDELATRWYQLGVFSPVNRLHSTNSPFNSKEPWRFAREPQRIMTEYLRLRAALVPYLYSAAWSAHVDGVGLVRPMYHAHPQDLRAFEVPGQFLFGPDLLVAPVTTPVDAFTNLASVDVWLPDGVWLDFCTGRTYVGGRAFTAHRPLDAIPVFAKAGAIVPLVGDLMADVSLDPESLVLRVFAGSAGSVLVIEDDGSATVTAAGRRETAIALEWHPRPDGSDVVDAHLVIQPPTGVGALPRRVLTVQVMGVASIEAVTVEGHDGQVPVAHEVSAPGAPDQRWAQTPLWTGLSVDLGSVDLAAGVTVHLWGTRMARLDLRADVFDLLDAAQIEFAVKEAAMAAARDLSGVALLAAWHRLDLPGNLYGALTELAAAGG